MIVEVKEYHFDLSKIFAIGIIIRKFPNESTGAFKIQWGFDVFSEYNTVFVESWPGYMNITDLTYEKTGTNFHTGEALRDFMNGQVKFHQIKEYNDLCKTRDELLQQWKKFKNESV